MKESMLFPRRVSSRSNRRVRVIQHACENWGKGVALTASNFRFGDVPQGFAAVCVYPDLFLEEWKRSFEFSFEDQVWTSIGKLDFGYRAGEAKIR